MEAALRATEKKEQRNAKSPFDSILIYGVESLWFD